MFPKFYLNVNLHDYVHFGGNIVLSNNREKSLFKSVKKKHKDILRKKKKIASYDSKILEA